MTEENDNTQIEYKEEREMAMDASLDMELTKEELKTVIQSIECFIDPKKPRWAKDEAEDVDIILLLNKFKVGNIMGMYDEINVDIKCPKCGANDVTWQSKNYMCNLDTIDPDKVQEFYTHCDKCDTFITYRRGEKKEEVATECRAEPYSLDEVEKMGFEYIEDEEVKK